VQFLFFGQRFLDLAGLLSASALAFATILILVLSPSNSAAVFSVSSIDSVHCIFYLNIWVNISNQRVDDVITVSGHRFVKFTFYGNGDIVFSFKNIIELEFGTSARTTSKT
jgi:hypothetical protein